MNQESCTIQNTSRKIYLFPNGTLSNFSSLSHLVSFAMGSGSSTPLDRSSENLMDPTPGQCAVAATSQLPDVAIVCSPTGYQLSDKHRPTVQKTLAALQLEAEQARSHHLDSWLQDLNNSTEIQPGEVDMSSSKFMEVSDGSQLAELAVPADSHLLKQRAGLLDDDAVPIRQGQAPASHTDMTLVQAARLRRGQNNR